jgi:hypothetical protein
LIEHVIKKSDLLSKKMIEDKAKNLFDKFEKEENEKGCKVND